MSHLKHATVSAWQRDHEGKYTAEINGFTLTVAWQPESATEPRGFAWTAEGPDGQKRRGEDLHEEIEIAMAEAEAATEREDDAPEEAA